MVTASAAGASEVGQVLSDSVASDSALPRFAVPSEVRAWGRENDISERRPLKATLMLVETAAWYVGLVVAAELVATWWGWVLGWVGLVMVMMRLDAIHHEGVHRSLYRRRGLNDAVAGVTGALEGFHAPIYRCFHLAHHAVTRQSGDPSDPEDFYDEMITRPMTVGPVTLPARASYVLGNLLGGLTFAVQLVVDAVMTVVGRPPSYVRAAALERHVRRWGWLPFALWGGAVALAVATGGVGELLRWWVVPMVLFLAGPYTFFALSEHYGAPADAPMVTSTGSVESNGLYRWVTLGGNYHLAHHVFPNASYWWLADADRRVRDENVRYYSGYLTFHRMVWRDMANRAPTD